MMLAIDELHPKLVDPAHLTLAVPVLPASFLQETGKDPSGRGDPLSVSSKF